MKTANACVFLFFVMICGGCSQGSNDNAITRGFQETSQDYPALQIFNGDDYSGTGIMGAYDLEISTDLQNVSLTPRRFATLGESYLVSGAAYFKIYPCADCLKIESLSIYEEDGTVVGVKLGMSVKHPFKAGNTSLPPSASNRLDLDVFDLALLVSPIGLAPTSFAFSDVDAYTEVMLNADGYSRELSAIVGDNTALPYKICYENSSNNRFRMGTNYQSFDVILALLPPPGMRFVLYMTMGYGWSAKKKDRLVPTYYIPEFNRKAAWKVVVTPPDTGNTWIAGDTVTEHDVVIDIFDWNHGATVASSFPDPTHTNYISSKSDINTVTVEVPGMTNSIVSATTVDTSQNGWNDPMTYSASFANENNLPTGTYQGIARVVDSRMPPIPSESDFGYGWARVWNDNAAQDDPNAKVAFDNTGNYLVSGCFKGTQDFDPGSGSDMHTSVGSTADGYVKKFDRDGKYLWGRSFGVIDMVYAYDVAADQMGDVYVLGKGPAGAILVKLSSDGSDIWTKTWNTTYIGVLPRDLEIDGAGNIYVAGSFYGDGDFDPGPGAAMKSSAGDSDAFISVFNPSGNHILVLTWGGFGIDTANQIAITQSGSVYTTGTFIDMADVDPGPGDEILFSYNQYPAPYLSKLDSTAQLQWAFTWGAEFGGSVPNSVAAGDSDSVYVCGYYYDRVDFDPGPGSAERTSSYFSNDSFVAKYDSNANFQWVGTWGASEYDDALDVAYDDEGFVYVTGYYSKTVDFNSGSGVDSHVSKGQGDSYLSKFRPDGTFIWAQTWGGIAFDMGTGIAIDAGSNICICGMFEGTVDFNPGSGDDTIPAYGVRNKFIVKFLTHGAAPEGMKDTIVHSDDGVTLDWRYVPEYVTYQTFKALIE